jgi:hypothetical protein
MLLLYSGQVTHFFQSNKEIKSLSHCHNSMVNFFHGCIMCCVYQESEIVIPLPIHDQEYTLLQNTSIVLAGKVSLVSAWWAF